MFDGTNLTLIFDVDQNRTLFGSYERSLTDRFTSPKALPQLARPLPKTTWNNIFFQRWLLAVLFLVSEHRL